jgi:serine/threonine protein phosphatase PrpC
MPIISAYKCDVGRKRERNEDYAWVDNKIGLYIVADGMGGHEAGEVASQLAATTVGETIVDHMRDITEPVSRATIEQIMIEAIENANKTVFDAAKAAEQKRRMGATIVVVLVRLDNAYISHAGDARAYLARGATIMQLTEDDSWGAKFAAVDAQTQENVKKTRLGHVLTKAVGQEAPVKPSFIEVAITPGDWLLLCSDGLWNMVEDEQTLAELKKASNNPDQAVEALVAAANDAGGKDNITIIAIKILSS